MVQEKKQQMPPLSDEKFRKLLLDLSIVVSRGEADDDINEEDLEQLVDAVTAVRQGTDISETNPDFYQRLLSEPALAEAFFKAIEALSASTPELPVPESEDENLLSIVVDDAMNGVNIMKKYPAFYTRMLIDAKLRNDFLDMLDMLESPDDTDDEDGEPLPALNTDKIFAVLRRRRDRTVTNEDESS